MYVRAEVWCVCEYEYEYVSVWAWARPSEGVWREGGGSGMRRGTDLDLDGLGLGLGLGGNLGDLDWTWTGLLRDLDPGLVGGQGEEGCNSQFVAAIGRLQPATGTVQSTDLAIYLSIYLPAYPGTMRYKDSDWNSVSMYMWSMAWQKRRGRVLSQPSSTREETGSRAKASRVEMETALQGRNATPMWSVLHSLQHRHLGPGTGVKAQERSCYVPGVAGRGASG